MIKADTQIFIFRENEIKSIETMAVSVSASELMEIEANVFEHIQPGSLAQLRLIAGSSSSPTFHLINNTFRSMEDGFLRLDESVVYNSEEKTVMEGLYLNTNCICSLVSNALEVGSLSLEEQDTPGMAAKMKRMMEAQAVLHTRIEDKIKCNEGDEMIFLYSSTTCVDWTAIIAIAVVAVVLYWMNDKLKERALKQFIVPMTLPKEGSVELQRAESFKASLPDLIRAMSVEREEGNGRHEYVNTQSF